MGRPVCRLPFCRARSSAQIGRFSFTRGHSTNYVGRTDHKEYSFFTACDTSSERSRLFQNVANGMGPHS